VSQAGLGVGSSGRVAAASYDIVGCGAVVERYHVPAIQLLRERGELTIAGCYDHDATQARRIAGIVGAGTWGTEATPREGDGVTSALIATPPGSHAEIARDYIGAGKATFIEKPFTAMAGEAAEVVEAARARDTRVAVNQFWRFYPGVNVARRWLHGQLEQVTSVEATEGFRLGWSPVSRYTVEDPYGGVIHDFGTHLLDMVLYMLGLDEAGRGVSARVDAVAKSPEREPSQECIAELTLDTTPGHAIGVNLLLSRAREMAHGVKVRGRFGVLFVPALLDSFPVLFQGDSSFRLTNAVPAAEPKNFGGCFVLTHREFLDAQRDPGRRSVIDGQRFLLLTEILESLWEGSRS
jgi:predicted dehydrogenase